MKKISIVFTNNLGEGTLECKGLGTFECLGMAGLNYPQDLMIDPSLPGVKTHPYFSKTYTCPPNNNPRGQCIMNYAVLIWGQQGVFIHEWPSEPTFSGNGNQGTHGCIHLRQGEAALVYNWIDTKTYVTIKRPW